MIAFLLSAVLCGTIPGKTPAVSASPGPTPAPSPSPSSSSTSSTPVEDRPLLHVVLFSLDVPGDADALAADSRRLLAGIPGVVEVRAGRKALADREAHLKDYDVALSVRLRSARDLPAYAAHPRHQELVQRWRSRARWKVIDFYAE